MPPRIDPNTLSPEMQAWYAAANRAQNPSAPAQRYGYPSTGYPGQSLMQTGMNAQPAQYSQASGYGGVSQLTSSMGTLSMASSSAAPAPVLDRRGNDVAATQRESRWAIGIWKNLTREQQTHLVGFIDPLLKFTRVARRAHRDEIGTKEFDRQMKKKSSQHRDPDMAAAMDAFKAEYRLGDALDAWEAKSDRTAIQLSEIIYEDIKEILDGMDTLLSHVPQLQRPTYARDQPYFSKNNRGREHIPSNRQRSLSRSSRHGGITDTEHLTQSMANIFSTKVEHYKGMAKRKPGAMTEMAFGAKGTPLIGGASGSIEIILALQEMLEKPFAQLEPHEQQERERLIGMYSAMLVMGGHHSMMECLLPAKAYGYFSHIPIAINADYNATMNAVGNYLTQLGLNSGEGGPLGG